MVERRVGREREFAMLCIRIDLLSLLRTPCATLKRGYGCYGSGN